MLLNGDDVTLISKTKLIHGKVLLILGPFSLALFCFVLVIGIIMFLYFKLRVIFSFLAIYIADKKDREEIIAGVAYKYSKNVKFIGNIFHIDKDTNTDDDAKDKYMLTAEVKW